MAVIEILPPGYQPDRLLKRMRAAIDRCELDLSDMVVFTEAASGAYVVTPVLAAMAGAPRVIALARASRYGSVAAVTEATLQLAARAGVAPRIEIVADKRSDLVASADVITNSGHVRPIDAEMIGWMKPTAVISLMYEAWELRAADLDMEACRRHGIPVAGTNESHPAVDVFSFLGLIAVRMLLDAGIAVRGSRIVVWCDNPLGPPLVQQLIQAAATVEAIESLEDGVENVGADVVLVAMRPRTHVVLGSREAVVLARRHPHAVVCQFWGDIDRASLTDVGLLFWPVDAPPPGHQGILPCSIGPEPIIRLQTGGLKVGQVMAQARRQANDCDQAIAAAVSSGFGQALLVELDTSTLAKKARHT
jgi:hypothetical protein